ncbi:MAG: hypothetical protein HPY44_07035 [Armatimonadetes bacterium]|nr:hypothetical protein [Armatimonadota bacterium]
MRWLVFVVWAGMLLASGAYSAPIQWQLADGGNGHWYERVDASLSWSDAKAAAESRSWMGMTGYLATISSAGENTFVTGLLGDFAWLGGYQLDNQPTTSTGWRWVTGEPWDFTYWAPGSGWVEPNDASNTMHIEDNEENGLVMGLVYGPGWNDLDLENKDNTATAYMVEYGEPGEVTPELSSASLLLLSVVPAGIAWWRRRRS